MSSQGLSAILAKRDSILRTPRYQSRCGGGGAIRPDRRRCRRQPPGWRLRLWFRSSGRRDPDRPGMRRDNRQEAGPPRAGSRSSRRKARTRQARPVSRGALRKIVQAAVASATDARLSPPSAKAMQPIARPQSRRPDCVEQQQGRTRDPSRSLHQTGLVQGQIGRVGRFGLSASLTGRRNAGRSAGSRRK